MTGDAYRVPHGERHYTTPVPRRPGVAGIAASLPFEDWHAITYETPTRAAAVQADVVVPLLQSVVSGALAGLVVLAAGLALASRTGAPAWLTLAAAGAAVVIVACAVWIALLRAAHDALTTRETITKRDDPQVIDATPTDTIRVEVIDKTTPAYRWELSDLPCNQATLARIFRGVHGGGMSLSSRDLARLPSMTRDRAARLLSELERNHFTHYPRGKRAPGGAELTAKGRALSRVLRV